jgi:hypothetical protein
LGIRKKYRIFVTEYFILYLSLNTL